MKKMIVAMAIVPMIALGDVQAFAERADAAAGTQARDGCPENFVVPASLINVMTTAIEGSCRAVKCTVMCISDHRATAIIARVKTIVTNDTVRRNDTVLP